MLTVTLVTALLEIRKKVRPQNRQRRGAEGDSARQGQEAGGGPACRDRGAPAQGPQRPLSPAVLNTCQNKLKKNSFPGCIFQWSVYLETNEPGGMLG